MTFTCFRFVTISMIPTVWKDVMIRFTSGLWVDFWHYLPHLTFPKSPGVRSNNHGCWAFILILFVTHSRASLCGMKRDWADRNQTSVIGHNKLEQLSAGLSKTIAAMRVSDLALLLRNYSLWLNHSANLTLWSNFELSDTCVILIFGATLSLEVSSWFMILTEAHVLVSPRSLKRASP